MKIHYLTPFSTEKNIVQEYNEACDYVPSCDWICIRDYDSSFFFPDQIKLVENAVKSGKADLYACMTNRCNVPELLIEGMFDEMDLQKHYNTAICQASIFGQEIKPYSGAVPGYFMLFPKKIFNEVGGFSVPKWSPDFVFDQVFSQKIERKGIIKGLYLLHNYRLWSKLPQYSTEHLQK